MKRKTAVFVMIIGMFISMQNVYAEELSIAEKVKAASVSYISNWHFMHYEENDEYIILFSLKNNDEKEIWAPGKIDVEIENENGEIVYKKQSLFSEENFGTWTRLGEEYTMASIRIKPEEIVESESKNGVVKINVYQDGFYKFKEIEIETDELPKLPLEKLYQLKVKEPPIKVSRTYGTNKMLIEEVIVTDITYEFKESFGGVDLYIYFTGEKTFDYMGEDNSDDCLIGWKLYDGEGYVVKTGTVFTQSICTGEKFKNAEENIYSLEPSEYRLELVNIT